MKAVEAAVKQLVSTNRNLVEDAQRYTLDPADVAKALADAKDGSVEQTVLLVLAKLNPVADSSKK
jgi:histone H3/H4